jgi:hypothetical protein
MTSDFPNLFPSDCFISSHFTADISLESETLSRGLEGLLLVVVVVMVSRAASSKDISFPCPL